ncbi:nucleolar pre-ribosomal-associated protein 1-like [Saccostrea echinata]|uniref:nucleolar pre-ribosomal-associated protein 1-like n=1 Tax=Saccostrea echinata TaxID=191078 RepID=UPI002A8298EE|nr:nucleolar pre-ribosomal-associated protein 1-like [Saccostrea echinata]
MKEKILSGKKRKQKSDKKGSDSPTKKKKQEDEKYTEIRFKFELRDPNLTFLALDKFVKQAEEYGSESNEYDIVTGYCRSSPECTEILQLLEGGKRKEKELHSIFGVLEAILLRLLDDLRLTKHAPVGKVILQKILSVGMPSVYFMLGPQVKASAVKTTLRMLGALVMLGENGAKALLSQLDTSHKHIQSLFNRRDLKDPQDVRTCLIHFIMSFLLVGSNSVIQQLINIKGFLNSLFNGLTKDKAANIKLILNTLLEKVIENETITKTQKLRLFNDYSLSQISLLYKWTGHPEQGEGTNTDDIEEIETHSSEDKEMVIKMAHKLLMEICCSHKNGINFYDKTLGTGGKNQNQLLTNFLTSVSKTVDGKEVQDLICQILKTCPDQIQHYLPCLIKNIPPRPTSRWCSTMNFLCEIYTHQPDSPVVLKSSQHHSPVKFVEMVMVHLIPIPAILTPVLQSLKHPHSSVQYFGMKFLGVLLQKSVNFLHCLNEESVKPSSSVYNQSERQEIVKLFKENILKIFPDCKLIMSCWRDLLFPKKLSEQKMTPMKGTEVNSEDKTDEKDLTKDEGVPEILQSDHMVEIEKALCLLQEFSPSVLVDNAGDISLLLEGVRKISEELSPLEVTGKSGDVAMEIEERSHDQQRALLPQLYLLKLLAGTDARKLPWTQQSQDGRSLIYLLLDMLCKISDSEMLNKVELLLVQLLHSTGLFEHNIRELELWIKHFTKFPQKQAIQQSLAGTFTTYISNSMSYVDRLCIHMSKVISSETDNAAMETENVTTFDNALKAVLEMDEEDFDNINGEMEASSETSLLRLPFTPLMIVALEINKKTMETENECQDTPELSQYLSGVLIDILHSQVEPVTITKLVKELHGDTISADVLKYMESLLKPGKKKLKQKSVRVKINMEDLYFTAKPVCLELMIIMLCKDATEEIKKAIRNELKSVSLIELDTVVSQILLYCGILLKTQNAEDIDLLNFCWEMLNIILTTMINDATMNEPEVMESGGSQNKLDVNIKFIEFPEKSREDYIEEMLQKILMHPSVFSYFLFPSGEITLGRSAGACKDMVICTTQGLCSILKEVKSLPQGTLSKCLDGYFHKGLTLLTDKKYARSATMTTHLNSFLQSAEIFISKEHVNKLLSILLSLSLSDLTNIGTRSLTEKGMVLLTLLDKVKNKEQAAIPFLDFNRFQTLFTLIDRLDLVDIETACLNLLTLYPIASLAMPKDVFIKSLKSDSVLRMEILCIVICQSAEAKEWFESWISNRDTMDLRPALLSLLLQYIDMYPKRLLESKTFLLQILKMYGKCLHLMKEKQSIPLEDGNQSEATDGVRNSPAEVMKRLTLKLNRLGVLGATLEEKVITLISTLMTERTNLCPLLINILSQLCGNQEDTKRRGLLLRNCQSCLLLSLKNKQTREENWIESLLNVLTSFSKDEIRELYTTIMIKEWPDFVKTLLRYRYSDKPTLQLLTTLTDIIYQDSPEADTPVSPDLPVQHLHDMLISHSQYLPIMFNEGHPDVKEPLVDLMTLLVEKDRRCCHTQHIGVLLGAYTASLSSTDQKILRLLCLYEKNKADLRSYRPYLWGMKAVEVHSVKKSLGASLTKQTTADEVMECLDQKILQTSILKLPLRRLMQPGTIQEAEVIKSVPEAYDPCFLLPVFSELVRSESVLDCRKFVENQCLSFTFACLSCHDSMMRGAAYHILNNFLSHLQGARFPEAKQVLYFVELVKNSIETPNTKLPCIITLFLAKVSTELLKPEDHMYKMLNAFLLLKPAMDTGNVPEFYKLFNSSALEYKLERAWMLGLLSEGLRETADFHIFEKRHILKMLLSFYESSISDNSTQLQVLQILRAASKERKVTSDLVRNHGILTWYSAMLQSKSLPVDHLKILLEILHNTWNTMLGESHRTGTQEKMASDSGKAVEDNSRGTDNQTQVSQSSGVGEDNTVTDNQTQVSQSSSVGEDNTVTDNRDEQMERKPSLTEPEMKSLPVSFTSQMIHVMKQVLAKVSSEVKLESYCQLLETLISILGYTDFPREKNQGVLHRYPQHNLTIRDALLLLGNLCNYGDDLETLQCVSSALKALRLENISRYETNQKLIKKSSGDSGSFNTQRKSEEMKKVIGLTLESLIHWNPSYLLSTHSTEKIVPLCIGVIIISSWLLKQNQNVIGCHFWKLFVDWLHSVLMTSRSFTEVLSECPKEGQIILEGLFGLYSHLSNCIPHVTEVDASDQGKIILRDRESHLTGNRSRTIKKLNEMVYLLCELKTDIKEKSWKDFSSKYRKITEPENQSILLRQHLLQHLTDSSNQKTAIMFNSYSKLKKYKNYRFISECV